MAQTNLSEDSFKRVLKEALVETFSEQRELFYEVFSEALEDFALAEAIREGKQTDTASRDEVLSVLRGKA